MGFMDNKELVQVAASRIEHVAPDFLFVGLGAPKQEYWIDNHRHLCNGVMVGVGGSFELIAGVTKRAPVALQRAGFEWLWRLAMDPRRLWKRYLMGNTVFVLLVFRQWVLGLMTNNPPEDDSCQIGR
jgi:N-acetylglucosaminyldiphosphoundecaprenol N-acetyl-beta-D-mannosaminyltransferase